jgi:ribosomal protein S19
MSRSKWKTPVFDFKFYKTLYIFDSNIKIWSRNNVVPESLLGKRVLIHNGNTFKKVLILREKIGFKFGDFSSTRKHHTPKFLDIKLKKKK